jgi:pSer/pThr/pTyr-binding forkhead associated (FHA) protein
MTGLFLLIIRGLLALALYAFLFWALITVWQHIRMHKVSFNSQQLPVIWLKIQNGDLIKNQAFQGEEITLGRDPTCDCVLQSETVSANHARFTNHHNQWWLEDLKSTNKTFINGEIVTTPVVVIPGDQISCGDVKILILEK